MTRCRWYLSGRGIVLAVVVLLAGCSSDDDSSKSPTGPKAVVADFYVSVASGQDSNPGTKTAPFKTIQRAIDTVKLAGGTVFVAEGLYTESLVLDDNVKLYGGYKDGTFVRDLANVITVIYGTATVVKIVDADSITIDGFTINCAPDPAPGGSAIAISLHNAVAVTVNGNSITALGSTPGSNGYQPEPPVEPPEFHPDGAPGGDATSDGCILGDCTPTDGGHGGSSSRECAYGGVGGDGCAA